MMAAFIFSMIGLGVPKLTPTHVEGKLQFVALRREDTGQFAVPGGIANNPGNTWNDKVRLEFKKEVSQMEVADDMQLQHMNLLLDELLQGADSSVVYRGCE